MSVREEGHQLVIHNSPYGQLIMGFILVMASLLITYLFARSAAVTCERAAGNTITCTVQEKVLGILDAGTRTISNIQSADLQQKRDKDGDRTYRIVFVTTEGATPLTNMYSSEYSNKHDLVESFNRFAQNTGDPSFEERLPVEWVLLLILGIFVAGGLGTIIFSQFVTVTLDKATGQALVEKDGLFGVRSEEYLLREIEEVEVQESRRRKGGATYRVALRLQSGQVIPLSWAYTSGRNGKEETAKQIRNFLNQGNNGMIGTNPTKNPWE